MEYISANIAEIFFLLLVGAIGYSIGEFRAKGKAETEKLEHGYWVAAKWEQLVEAYYDPKPELHWEDYRDEQLAITPPVGWKLAKRGVDLDDPEAVERFLRGKS